MIMSLDADCKTSIILQASFDEYDGYAPTDQFIVDAVPHSLPPEYVALAGYLVFGTWASGTIIFPESITPELSNAIEEDSKPVRIRPQGINLVPKRVKMSDEEIAISLGCETAPDTGLSVEVLPRGFSKGSLRSSNRLQVSSNAFVFSGALDRKFYFRPIIAAALLANEDFLPGKIFISADMAQQESMNLHALLQSIGVELVLSSEED